MKLRLGALFVARRWQLLLSKTTSDGLSQAVSSVRRIDICAGGTRKQRVAAAFCD
jgi:hypothetical protein